MMDKSAVISQTKTWLSTVIIAHQLCPFAKREYDNDRIHYVVIETPELESQLEHIMSECIALDNDTNRETSLLIFPETLSNFESYLEVLDLANALLKQQGYEGIYQLASFHPHYLFEGAKSDDPANYTNRSPYPMLHILRETSVEAAVKRYPDPEKIPERNIKTMEGLGLDIVKALLEKSYA